MDLNQALEKAYAKSTGETIREHTDNMLVRLKKLIEIRGKEILCCCPDEWREDFWELAKIIIEYHDYGKLHSPFQRIMCKLGGFEEPYEILDVPEIIPHNFLSPCFLPEQILKKYENLLPVIIQAISYHHERDIDEKMFKKIVDIVAEQDLSRFKKPLFLKYWQYLDPRGYINPKDNKVFKLLVLLKGLLHRVDYTASGDMDVEIVSENIGHVISNKLKEKNSDLNEIQKFALKNNDRDLLIIAPTGSGKTEAGALYVNRSKGFFVLPLRVSIDSIYDRLTGIPKGDELKYGFNNVGLMHSTSLFKHIEDIGKRDSDIRENALPDGRFEQIYKAEKEAKNLSYPLSITTPDQIFPFVFKYGGFERIYSTFGYSKIVVDEIQMYNPRMLAYMLKGLQVIKELGGKIMIMTATFPEFLKKEMQTLGINFSDKQIFKYVKTAKERHQLRVERDKDILEDNIIEEIENSGKQKKVLVICNTVNKAVDVYKKIKNKNKFLLHSRFIQKHRKILETEIQNFAPNKPERHNSTYGIWITTQIAEVSLDIDFDILYTELSSIDSLIQRMGRVNRRGRYKPEEPNVIVCCKKKTENDKNGCSGIGNIYDEKIFDFTKEELKDGILSEDEKMKLVERIYDNEKIKDTNYYKEFKDSLSLINEIWEVGKIYNPIESLKQAQRQFREIFTITLIPQEIYSNNLQTLEKLKSKIKSKEPLERVNARKQLLDFTVSIPWHYIQNIKPTYFADDVYIVPFKYDFDEINKKGVGLLIDKLNDYNLCD